MGNCKDCNFWDHIWFDETKGTSACNGIEWEHPMNKIPENGAMFELRANDDHGLHFSFQTGPMFGCMNFKPKREKRYE